MTDSGTESLFSDFNRRAQDAATRFARTVGILRYAAENPPNDAERWLAGYAAETLLWKVLTDAISLVHVLNDDSDAGEIQLHARALHEALRARRLAAKMENVTGRTPEEAEAFLTKARELRGG